MQPPPPHLPEVCAFRGPDTKRPKKKKRWPVYFIPALRISVSETRYVLSASLNVVIIFKPSQWPYPFLLSPTAQYSTRRKHSVFGNTVTKRSISLQTLHMHTFSFRRAQKQKGHAAAATLQHCQDKSRGITAGRVKHVHAISLKEMYFLFVSSLKETLSPHIRTHMHTRTQAKARETERKGLMMKLYMNTP